MPRPDAPTILRVAAGLTSISALPPRGGYLEAEATWDSLTGPAARAGLGWHLRPGLRTFAFGAASRGAYELGAGLRWDW